MNLTQFGWLPGMQKATNELWLYVPHTHLQATKSALWNAIQKMKTDWCGGPDLTSRFLLRDDRCLAPSAPSDLEADATARVGMTASTTA